MRNDLIVGPRLIQFPRIGKSSLGYISVAENADIPFEVKRVYWTYYTPESVVRGGHAHHKLEQILISLAGKITIDVELLDSQKERFVLDKPNVGLYIPKLVWRTLQYSHNAVQLCLAGSEYDEADYIRDYESFKHAK